VYELYTSLGIAIPEAAEGYEPRVVTGTISAVNPDVALVKFTADSRTVTGVLPITEAIRGRRWEAGEAHTLLQCEPALSGKRPMLSAVRPGFVEAVMHGVVPEVRDGRIRVMAVARRPGTRVKVAVATTTPGLDAVAACVGRRHNRVDAIREALGGDQVDLVAWHPDPRIYLKNALQPAQVNEVIIDPKTRTATAHADAHQMAAAVGGGGLNSMLAGRLLGVQVRIV
jgi:N utilization substance protein A